MKNVRVIKGVLVSLAVLGFCLPQPVLAAAVNPAPEPAVTDVALGPGGVLLGQVVDQRGTALTKVPVALRDQANVIANTETDQQGYFAVRGLKSGVYQVVAAEGQGTFRVWAAEIAPPSAQQGALIVSGEDTVRGNLGCFGAFFTNPWVLVGLVATAVAVPVAITASQDPSSP